MYFVIFNSIYLQKNATKTNNKSRNDCVFFICNYGIRSEILFFSRNRIIFSAAQQWEVLLCIQLFLFSRGRAVYSNSIESRPSDISMFVAVKKFAISRRHISLVVMLLVIFSTGQPRQVQIEGARYFQYFTPKQM